jgi:3-dehydroquinate dehydratase
MCGGDLDISNETSVCTCQYCGSKQTLPKINDAKRADLYERANSFRRSNEYDKASALYEFILSEDRTDSEAYWSLVLCRYGVEYVEDPTSHKRIPTCHRTSFTSILLDDDYKQALNNADAYAKSVYEAEAAAIDALQKDILKVSSREDPFDVFICYKETDNFGRRTRDSVLAQDLYGHLTSEGFKVFFARITLEDKIGSEYEPIIFAALQSAKIMLALGTNADHFNAVWVKNEWSRFLALIKNGAKKTLIPVYSGMDAYGLPDEFSHLQAQDLNKVGCIQDLIRGIHKICDTGQKTIQVAGGTSAANTVVRGMNFLEDGDAAKAQEYFERALDMDVQCSSAYLGNLLIKFLKKNIEELKKVPYDMSKTTEYKRALTYANNSERKVLEEIHESNLRQIEVFRLLSVLTKGGKKKKEQEEQQKKQKEQQEKHEQKLKFEYNEACEWMRIGNYDLAIHHFKNAHVKIQDYSRLIQEAKEQRAELEKQQKGKERLVREAEEQKRREQEAEQRRQEEQRRAEQSKLWEQQGLCRNCGGQMGGLFSKKCKTCGKPA